MGLIKIQEETTKNCITLIGKEAGLCWGANTEDNSKNYKRGIECLSNQHGRTFEFPTVYFIADGYSARVIREFYTHIGGSPTRLQSSTRYIDYGDFKYVIPKSIEDNQSAKKIYTSCMSGISSSLKELEYLNIAREDCGMLLPLGMETKIVCKINLRTLMDMSRQRMCARAYWEFRELFSNICDALSEYSDEWKYVVDNYFMPKCEYYGFCTEKFSCGRKPKKG